MSTKKIGIEEARKNLGELVAEAERGTEILLTRRGRPVARITAYQEDPMPDTDLLAPISDETRAAIASVVEGTIEREYGITNTVEGARFLAIAGLEMDLGAAWHAANPGHEIGLRGYTESTLRILVTAGLKARECQCNTSSDRDRTHNHRYTCHNHYEADVPPIDGMKLCGACHIDLYQVHTYLATVTDSVIGVDEIGPTTGDDTGVIASPWARDMTPAEADSREWDAILAAAGWTVASGWDDHGGYWTATVERA